MIICYGLIPFVWFSFPLTFIGQFITISELTFFSAFQVISFCFIRIHDVYGFTSNS